MNVSDLVIPGGEFSRMDLLLLTDLYNVLEQYERAIENHDDWLARSSFGEGGSVQAGNFELDPNARHRLTVAWGKRKLVLLLFFRDFRILIFGRIIACPMLFSLKKFLNIPCAVR